MEQVSGKLAERIANALRRHGTEILLCGTVNNRARFVYACVLPYVHRNRQYLEERLTVLGYGEPNTFLYLGEVAEGLGVAQPGELVQDGDERFVFSSCTVLRYRGEAAYVWGVLKRAEGSGAV